MLQRLSIALAQVKAGNTSENLLMKSEKSYILCIEKKKSLKNYTRQKSRVLYTFVSNKSFGQLLDISPENVRFLKTFDSETCIMKYGLQIKILIL